MQLISKLTALLLLFIAVTGCEEKDKQAKAPDTVVFKSQLEALDKAKQVERILQGKATQQRKIIDENTNSQGQ